MITLLLSLAQASWTKHLKEMKHHVGEKFHNMKHAAGKKYHNMRFEHDHALLEKMVKYVEEKLESEQTRPEILKEEKAISADINRYKKDYVSKYGAEKESNLVKRAEAVLQKLGEAREGGE